MAAVRGSVGSSSLFGEEQGSGPPRPTLATRSAGGSSRVVGRARGATPIAPLRYDRSEADSRVQVMTEALKKAFEVAAQLADADQDSLAAAILTEIEGYGAWGSALLNSQHRLADLAEEAREEYRRGGTRPLDPRDP